MNGERPEKEEHSVVIKRQLVSLGLAAMLLSGCSGGNQILRVATEPEDARVTINGVPGDTYVVDHKYDFPMQSLYVKAKKPGFHTEQMQVKRELDAFTAVVWSIVPALFLGTAVAYGRPDAATALNVAFWGVWTALPWAHSFKYREVYGLELQKGSSRDDD